MRVFHAVAVMALLAGPAYAQQQPMQKYGEPDKEKSQTQKDADKAAERAYQKSLDNVPDKGPADPWGAVRSEGTPKTAKDPAAKSKTKISGTTK
jgi:hypothetical protein